MKKKKECVLLLDEMALKQGVEFDVATSKYFGEMTLLKSNELASHVLVIMLCEIYSRWKQTVVISDSFYQFIY